MNTRIPMTEGAGRVGAVVLALALVACGSDDKTGKETGEKPTNKPASKEPELGPDWSKRTISRVKDAVDGIGFMVSLPSRLSREEKKADGDFPGYVTWQHKGNFFEMPGFTAQIDALPPQNLEQAADSLKGFKNDRVVEIKQTLPDGGWLAAAHETSKQFIEVKIWRKHKSGKMVGFSITQRTGKPMPNFDAHRAWLLEVAKSFKLGPEG